MKPANVLLRSSNIDSRGFTAKVSDFGLSRCGGCGPEGGAARCERQAPEAFEAEA
jgi:hypothetical protein